MIEVYFLEFVIIFFPCHPGIWNPFTSGHTLAAKSVRCECPGWECDDVASIAAGSIKKYPPDGRYFDGYIGICRAVYLYMVLGGRGVGNWRRISHQVWKSQSLNARRIAWRSRKLNFLKIFSRWDFTVPLAIPNTSAI